MTTQGKADRAGTGRKTGLLGGGLLMAPLAAAVLGLGLFAPPAEQAQAAYPGTNGKIYFTEEAVGGGKGVRSANPDGSARDTITHPAPNQTDRSPEVSGDGSTLVFQRVTARQVDPACSDRCRFDFKSDVYVSGADGSAPRLLHEGSWSNEPDGAGYHFEPAVSPDGKKVAFLSMPDGEKAQGPAEVKVVDADGSGLRAVHSAEAVGNFGSRVEWSPDGTKLLFSTGYHGPASDPDARGIYVMNADGSSTACLVGATGLQEQDASWSPDGKQIVFVSRSDAASPRRAVEVMQANGSGRKTVVGPDGFYELPLNPSFSPDATLIAFSSDSENVKVVDLSGGVRSTIAHQTDHGQDPAWQPVVPAPQPAPNAKPTVTSIRPTPGFSTTDNTPAIRATARDAETDLSKANVRVLVDGRARAFAYDASTDRAKLSPALAKGRHIVKVEARDERGLLGVRRWAFYVK